MSEQRPRVNLNGLLFKQRMDNVRNGDGDKGASKGGRRNRYRRKEKKEEGTEFKKEKANANVGSKSGGEKNRFKKNQDGRALIAKSDTTPAIIDDLKKKFPRDFEKHKIIVVKHTHPIKTAIMPVIQRLSGFSGSHFAEEHDDKAKDGSMWTQFRWRSYEKAAEAIT